MSWSKVGKISLSSWAQGALWRALEFASLHIRPRTCVIGAPATTCTYYLGKNSLQLGVSSRMFHLKLM